MFLGQDYQLKRGDILPHQIEDYGGGLPGVLDKNALLPSAKRALPGKHDVYKEQLVFLSL